MEGLMWIGTVDWASIVDCRLWTVDCGQYNVDTGEVRPRGGADNRVFEMAIFSIQNPIDHHQYLI